MKRTPQNYANGFASVYGESVVMQRELLRLRDALLAQAQAIDDFISGESRRTMNVHNPGDCLRWAREWYEITQKEAGEKEQP